MVLKGVHKHVPTETIYACSINKQHMKKVKG